MHVKSYRKFTQFSKKKINTRQTHLVISFFICQYLLLVVIFYSSFLHMFMHPTYKQIFRFIKNHLIYFCVQYLLSAAGREKNKKHQKENDFFFFCYILLCNMSIFIRYTIEEICTSINPTASPIYKYSSIIIRTWCFLLRLLFIYDKL